MNPLPLYPLRFEPIYQYRPWGGRRLASLLSAPMPEGPVGEAWVLSDRDEHPSVIASGPLKGRTIAQLLEAFPQQMLGKLAGRFSRFPLLLKFLDVRERLSVQVHPSDHQTKYLPAGERGKTEAWVVLEAGPQSRVYAGLRPATTAEELRRAVAGGTVADLLASFTPQTDDGVFVRAGTVHSLSDVVVFEVQENSDVTFRLYDWDRIDAKTGRGRALQVDQAMACMNLPQGAVSSVVPVVEALEPVKRERLFLAEEFGLWRIRGALPFRIGARDTARVLVCIAGNGWLEHEGNHYPFARGDVLLLPSVVGECLCEMRHDATLLEISLPEKGTTS
ncbi:MAG: type I phosphomannose isomerase catalytic subunit [Gammaproteobacteria bacterium]